MGRRYSGGSSVGRTGRYKDMTWACKMVSSLPRSWSFCLKVHIDENGDAEGNFTVVTLLDDVEVIESLGMSMQPVGYFQYRADGKKLPVNIKKKTKCKMHCIFFFRNLGISMNHVQFNGSVANYPLRSRFADSTEWSASTRRTGA